MYCHHPAFWVNRRACTLHICLKTVHQTFFGHTVDDSSCFVFHVNETMLINPFHVTISKTISNSTFQIKPSRQVNHFRYIMIHGCIEDNHISSLTVASNSTGVTFVFFEM
uniref:Uncharacterized protein n=1 Tax=Setaria italica TaxID=4555 RepID=K4AGY0_SETIT